MFDMPSRFREVNTEVIFNSIQQLIKLTDFKNNFFMLFPLMIFVIKINILNNFFFLHIIDSFRNIHQKTFNTIALNSA